MRYDYQNPDKLYAPPFLGNGDISLQLGPDGSMNPVSGGSGIQSKPNRAIWWEGRRYLGQHTKPLVPFGIFGDSLWRDDVPVTPLYADQVLDPVEAKITCDTVYPGCRVVTEAFVETARNLVVLRKTFTAEVAFRYGFAYSLCNKNKDDTTPPLMQISTSVTDNGGTVDFTLTDRVGYRGTVRLACDVPADVTATENGITVTLPVEKSCVVTLYLLLTDTMDQADPAAFGSETIRMAVELGYDKLKAVHSQQWRDYLSEGYAETGDAAIDRVYQVAQYHQRIFTTKWSLPVGLNDVSWDGRFFGFDEHYMVMGLLTSNHMDRARRVPEFRRKGLPIAVTRASSRHHNTARYPWETTEDGNEAAPPGFWYEHIFHMAAIPLSGWEYYRYTGDVDFLRQTVYPVLSACGEFFRLHMLYRTAEGKLIVGKCTDLERLGSSVENPYMTTCGVVATFRAYAEASRLLETNLDLADVCDALSDELLAALPHDETRYLPYPGCTDRSISAFSGTYPFPVIPAEDPLQLGAIEDYLAYEDTFGNMYEMGSGVCSWYACWKAVVYDRLGRGADAMAALRYVADTAGAFGELFEIGNAASGTYVRPWFTTAAGMYVHGVNEALLSGDETGLRIGFGLDEAVTDFRFRLAAHGGFVVACVVRDCRVESLTVYGTRFCQTKSVRVLLPERLGGARVVTVCPVE